METDILNRYVGDKHTCKPQFCLALPLESIVHYCVNAMCSFRSAYKPNFMPVCGINNECGKTVMGEAFNTS
jgi:hypothetical protein